MDAVRINVTQVLGAMVGLLVIVAGVFVNVRNFGADIPLPNIAIIIVLGIVLSLGIFLLSRD
ncbi:hypothetical protein [Methanocella arvoryzae]|uniref:hypothetical protein n=1 Tax=Methanocella arvoryzae TaxID=1175445 RepID=UPI000324950F|nr:hypothetical protein [Methanocella arvoryzae]